MVNVRFYTDNGIDDKFLVNLVTSDLLFGILPNGSGASPVVVRTLDYSDSSFLQENFVVTNPFNNTGDELVVSYYYRDNPEVSSVTLREVRLSIRSDTDHGQSFELEAGQTSKLVATITGIDLNFLGWNPRSNFADAFENWRGRSNDLSLMYQRDDYFVPQSLPNAPVANAYYGFAGDDRFDEVTAFGKSGLRGGAKADYYGGTGDDRYAITVDTSRIFENAGEGEDTVFAHISFSLRDHSQHLENLVLRGSAPLNGFGNGANNEITGTNKANELRGFNGRDLLVGKGGADTLLGGNQSDTLKGGNGRDTLNGQAGSDILHADNGDDTLIGGAGIDALYFTGTRDARVDLNQTTAQDTGFGLDTIRGIENVKGGGGNDTLLGTSGSNYMLGESGADTIRGRAGNDLILGGFENDTLYGGSGGDYLAGGYGSDDIYAGNDQQVDMIVFKDRTDSLAHVVVRDTIYQFDASEDLLDLRQVDANSLVDGNQTLTFSAQSATHSVWLEASGTDTYVWADTDGNNFADFGFLLKNVSASDISAADFLF